MNNTTHDSRSDSPIRKSVAPSEATSPIEASPTTVMADVTASYPEGLRELKRIQGYSDQLFLPQEMVLGNDLMKVWDIDDEVKFKESPAFHKAGTMIEPARTPQTARPSFARRISANEDASMELDEQNQYPFFFPPPLVPAPVSERGSTSTIVLSNDDMEASVEHKEPPKHHRQGHRRSTHRRNNTHFDFSFH